MQIQSQESDLKSQEDDISRAKAELNRLQQEEAQLEQSIQAGKVQLETIIKSLKSTQEEINQVAWTFLITRFLSSPFWAQRLIISNQICFVDSGYWNLPWRHCYSLLWGDVPNSIIRWRFSIFESQSPFHWVGFFVVVVFGRGNNPLSSCFDFNCRFIFQSNPRFKGKIIKIFSRVYTKNYSKYFH